MTPNRLFLALAILADAGIGVLAFISAIVASLTGFAGVAFGAWRTARAQERTAAAENIAASEQVTKVTAVEAAQAVLVGTIGEMRTEMARQDAEHEARMAEVEARHAAEIARLNARLDQLEARLAFEVEGHTECRAENERLQRRIAELTGGRRD